MDAFFVSVELLDRPELRGRPVIVGGAGERGVVAAASYEARAFGVHSAMSSVQAQRLCPGAVFLHGRHDRYAEVSARVLAIFGSFTPLVEPISLDEAFLDVRGARRLHGSAVAIAHAIRRRVADDEHLTCSVGVAPSKFVAKLASEAAKPRATPQGPRPGPGVRVVTAGEVQDFLRPLPAQALWGVGPKTLARLERLGVRTVGDLADLPVGSVTDALGVAVGRHLHRLAHGIDDRPVQPERDPKSFGHEETFPHDLRDRERLERELVRMADAVAARLRAHGLAGRTVTLKVRFGDFTTLTRSTTTAVATDSGRELARLAKGLLDGVDPAPGVRLLGVSVGNLAAEVVRQLRLDEVVDEASPGLDAVVDRIRGRFGEDAIGPAVIVGPDGLRRKRRGDQHWGPGEPDASGPPVPTPRG